MAGEGRVARAAQLTGTASTSSNQGQGQGQITRFPLSNPELAKQQLKSLRELAHNKGLRWRIHCIDSVTNPIANAIDPGRAFIAYAEPRSVPRLAEYIEDGAKPWWVLRAATEEEAVKELYIAIQGAPNIYPNHKPSADAKKHKPCPLPLEGE